MYKIHWERAQGRYIVPPPTTMKVGSNRDTQLHTCLNNNKVEKASSFKDCTINDKYLCITTAKKDTKNKITGLLGCLIMKNGSHYVVSTKIKILQTYPIVYNLVGTAFLFT